MSRFFLKTGLFVLAMVLIAGAYGFILTRSPSLTVSTSEYDMQRNPAVAGATIEDQELTKLLVASNQSPEISKCNFEGTYQSTQTEVRSHNGAKCHGFESQIIKFNSTTTDCTKFLDPKQEIFLSCINPTNPVTKCDGIVYVNVNGKNACEYFISITKID